jgi:hypothetical protein
MSILKTDAVLWYNVGEFGKAGYCVPNWSNDPGSLNPQILNFVSLVGRNLFAIMHHEDANLRVPPSINTVKRIHKLYLRAAQLLAGNAIPPGQDNMEPGHSAPAGEVFRVYPCPFFLVRNPFLRKWANLILMSLADAMQHTENAKSMEISTAFAGQVGQYIKRVYVNMAVELFGKDKAVAEAPQFALTDADFAAYNPADFFTSTEMVDTVPRIDRRFTEDALELLAEGIPVTQLPELRPWPNDLPAWYAANRSDQSIDPAGLAAAAAGEAAAGTAAAAAASAPTVAVIPPPPGP